MDQNAWDEFVRLYYPAIFSYCLRFFGRRADAEEVVQDIFIKAYQNRDQLREAKAEKSCIYTIARHTCVDRQRWWKRYFTRFKDDAEEEAQGVASSGDPELAQSLQRLIAELPQKQREVFILRHWHDFSTAETAQLLGIEEGTVKSHLKRAIDRLKAALRET